MLSSNPRHNMTLQLYEANIVAKYLRASSSISKIVCVDVGGLYTSLLKWRGCSSYLLGV